MNRKKIVAKPRGRKGPGATQPLGMPDTRVDELLGFPTGPAYDKLVCLSVNKAARQEQRQAAERALRRLRVYRELAPVLLDTRECVRSARDLGEAVLTFGHAAQRWHQAAQEYEQRHRKKPGRYASFFKLYDPDSYERLTQAVDLAVCLDRELRRFLSALDEAPEPSRAKSPDAPWEAMLLNWIAQSASPSPLHVLPGHTPARGRPPRLVLAAIEADLYGALSHTQIAKLGLDGGKGRHDNSLDRVKKRARAWKAFVDKYKSGG
jgi:hypothetical protein